MDVEDHAKSPYLWLDRWYILTKEPGWQPAYLGDVTHAKPVTTQSFHKYETQIPMSLSYYVLLQYFIVLTGTTLFLFNAENMNIPLQIAVAGLIIFSIIDMGAIFEKRKWVWFAELIRLGSLPILFVLLFDIATVMWVVTAISALLFVLSSVWITRYRVLFQF